MIISVKFDTKTKELTVTKDGQTMDNISEVSFFGFEEGKGAVNIRQFEHLEDDSAFKITEIRAKEDEPHMGDMPSFDSVGITIPNESSDNITLPGVTTINLAQGLFPHKRLD